MKTINVTRLEQDYAWAECSCKNTVKFNEDGTIGVCPACSTVWKCDEGIATQKGKWPE